MKRTFLLTSALLILGIFLGELLVDDPGYVLILKNQTSLETSANIAIIFSIAIIAGGIILFLLLFNTLGIGRVFGNWLFSFFYKNSLSLFEEGITDYQKGHWDEAYRKLNRVAGTNLSVTAYTSAALAAEKTGKADKADQLIERAKDKYTNEKHLINLTQSELLINRSDYQSASQLLRELLSSDLGNQKILQLLTDCYRYEKNWLALSSLLPQIKSNKNLSNDDFRQLENETWPGVFTNQHSADGLSTQDYLAHIQNAWINTPERFKQNEKISQAYTRLLTSLKQEDSLQTTPSSSK